MTVVLDASALLAFAYDEKGADRVAAELPDALMSAVNVAEVVSKLNERKIPADSFEPIWLILSGLSRDFTSEHALACGALREATRSAGLSLGDRACLSLARELALPVLTADKAWATLDIGLRIEVIR